MLCKSNFILWRYILLGEDEVWITANFMTFKNCCDLCCPSFEAEGVGLQRTVGTQRKAKKSLTGDARALNLYNVCTLNCARICPSYCNNPEQCSLGAALNRSTVWRASEVQKEVFKLCLFLISGYMYMEIKMYPSWHLSTMIIFHVVRHKQKI